MPEPLGHIDTVHRDAELDGIRFRWGLIPPCGRDDCPCNETGAIAVYAALPTEDRWFGLSTHDPDEDVRETLYALHEADDDWPVVRAWLENDSALYGVPWANVCITDQAPRKIMVRQQLASLKTPARFRSEPIEGLLALRRAINELDPRLVLRLLVSMDDYCQRTDTFGPVL